MACCLAAVGCAGDDTRIDLTVGDTVFRVELAVTDQQRARGLMFREELGRREGMLFVFDNEQPRSFWMRNTPLPLSIAYIDAKGVIVHITDMEPHSQTPVPSRAPAQYALEVNRGAFEEAGIRVGDFVQLPDSLR